MATAKDLSHDIGGFIRDLRRNAKVSLRQLAEQAGVSNPYLSQIERGLRKPSAEVLQQLASALRVSTPMMYLRAGLLDDKEGQGVLDAIAVDPDLTMTQKQSLSQIYETFRRENVRLAQAQAAAAAAARPEPQTSAQAAPVDTPPVAPTPPGRAGRPVSASSADAGYLASTPPAGGEHPASVPLAEAVLESVAVTEAASAPAPARAGGAAAKRIARKAVKRASATRTAPVEEEKR